MRQRVALVATLARLYVGVVLIDRECECRAAIVAGSWALCTITCASSSVTSASATAAGLRPGNMSQIGARSAYLTLRDFDPANVSCGSLPDIADGYIGSSSTPENSKWPE